MEFKSIELLLKSKRTCQIRHAREQDASNVIALERKILQETALLPILPDEYSNNLIEERNYLSNARKSNKIAVLVAIIDGDLAGIAMLKPESENIKESHIATIEVKVQRKYNNQGIGKALTECLTNLARETGFKGIYAYSNDKNKRVQTMLTRLGYKAACSIPFKYMQQDGSFDNELIFVKTF